MENRRKAILFHPDFIEMIRGGAKTLTYRLDDDRLDYLNVGDRVEAEDSSTGRPFAELEITAVSYTTFGELPIDRSGNVAHPSKAGQRAAFHGYYGRDIEDTERVLILEFRLLRSLGRSS